MSPMRFYYDPLTDFDRQLEDALATRFRYFVPADIGRGVLFRPRMEIHDSKDANTVTATFELPGMKRDDITIDVYQDCLTVTGEAKKPFGKFSQTLRLPSATRPGDVKTKMENGILTVTFPKTTTEQGVQRVTIQ